MKARRTKIQEVPEEEILTKKTRKDAALAEAEDASVAELPRKPRKAKKPKKRVAQKETLEEMGKRYTGVMQEYFSELSTDRRYDGFTVSCTLAEDEITPGMVWIFATLRKSAVAIFHVSCPLVDFPEDLHNVTGLLFIELCLRGLRIAEQKGI